MAEQLQLDGCTSEPLMAYLKALGVLRLVSDQDNPEARGAWRDNVFLLETKLDRQGLVDFFLQRYEPTPIVAPWAGGSGFFASDNKVAVDTIAKSKSKRLATFADVIRQVRDLLEQ